MDGLTTLTTVLTLVFSVFILALVIELIYVLWRRRVFRRRTDPELGSDPYSMTPSKEQLLYFFCCKNPSRVGPAGIATVAEPPGAEAADDELAKWQQGMYGPSRVLFTIKEEEREGTETEPDNEATKTKTVLADEATDQSLGEVGVITQAVEEEATPFSTPCASPPYYTPSPSPSHDKHSPEKCENDVSFVN